jgi:histidinol-phosphate aminotransferase
MTYVTAAAQSGALRLHLNENTAGCSPAVLRALHSIARTEASEYPDYSGVTAQAEAYFGVDGGWVQITNGLDEGLHVVAQSSKLIDPASEAIVVEPAFEMYAASIESVGGRQVTVPPTGDLAFSVDAVLAAISPRTRLIYLCDPNNPSGLPIRQQDILRLAEAAPNAIVFVDEAYADFSGRTLIGPTLDRQRNIVVGRTFAKAHGLAALRVGAIVAHPDTLAPLRRILPPYSVNVCAVLALQAALHDRAYVAWYVSQAEESRSLIYAWCTLRGYRYWPSEGNFVLLHIGDDAQALVRALAEQQIQIRDRSRQPGLAGCVRITAGVVEDTARCLEAMEVWHASRGN